jgi:GTP-binding protein
MFYDRSTIHIEGGHGGNGCASFRREKFVPRGGPSGGSGGQGGAVVVRANAQLNTLVAYKYAKHFKATPGEAGQNWNKHGKKGKDIVLEVPIGTIVYELASDTNKILLGDLAAEGTELVVARGGKGGMGNKLLATSLFRAPKFAQRGEPGETKEIVLELKLIADVGLIGYPNVGKSTLISVISNAKPKIADYPFTTIEPNLGLVRVQDTDFVVADIPGLIEGSHEGKGLGHQFLRHVERCRLLVHVLDGSKSSLTELKKNFAAINRELHAYAPDLAHKPQLVVINKSDLMDDKQRAKVQTSSFAKTVEDKSKSTLLFISALTKTGLGPLLYAIVTKLKDIPKTLPQVEQTKVFKPLDYDKHFSVERKNDHSFIVRGKKVEQMVVMNDLGNEQALHWLRDRLRGMGVFKELKKRGVQDGDSVIIKNAEFIWDSSYE